MDYVLGGPDVEAADAMARRAFAGLVMLLALGTSGIAGAQGYPARPIRLIIPFPPGGATDTMMRPIADKMGERLGQPLVLENRGGAGGTIGTDAGAKARPDGYTLLVGIISPLAVNVELFGGKLPYDPLRDFAPISMITRIPVLLTVHPSMPARSMKEVIALAKRSPGRLTYGSAGVGTTNNLTGELVNLEAGIRITHVPFKGAGPAVIALIGGETDMLYAGPPGSLPHVRSGRLRAIAVTGAKRMATLPEVPTMMESGLPGVQVSGWYSLVAPAGTPREIIERLRTALIEAMAAPNVIAALADQGAVLESSTPAELRDFIEAEIGKWSRVIRAAGISVK